MTRDRVNEIDLLRFIAAFAVVLFHYTFRGTAANSMTVMPYPLLAPIFKYGYLGVELFFIISGFVILMTADSGSLRKFFVARVVRLYPAFWICCTLTFAAILLFGAPRFSATWPQYLMNMTLLSEFFDVKSIEGVYWSLFVEIRFYVLVALVLVIGKIRHAQWFLVCWLAASIALEIAPHWRLNYLFVVDYSAFFIAGATFYLVWSKGLDIAKAGILLASWGLAVYESLGRLPRFEQQFHGDLGAVVVAAIVTAFFAVMWLVSLRSTGFFGRKNWLAVGAVTYPLYLLHENIGFIIFNNAYPAINAHVLLWGTVALMIALSYGVHVWVERQYSPILKDALNRSIDRLARIAGRTPSAS